PTVIQQYIGEVAAWLNQQGVEPMGPPIIRYHTCPSIMKPDALLDVTIGWQTTAALKGNGRIIADTLPAGRYATLIFTGVENGVEGNRALIEWAAEQGIRWDSWDDEIGDAFGGRVEFMLDGPNDDPNSSNWKTE